MYKDGFLKVLDLRVLARMSKLAFIIGAWFALKLMSKSAKFAGDGSAVDVSLHYWSKAFIRMNF